MSLEKKFLPKIYAPELSSGKKWFVYWYEGKKRVRKYGDINQELTYKLRMESAERLIRSLNIEQVSCTKEKAYQYMEDHRGAWRKKTYQTVKSKLDCFYERHGDDPLTSESVEAFFVWLKSNRHKTTYNDYRRKLKMVFSAIGEEAPFEGISKLRASMTPARYFQQYQIKRLKKHMIDKDPELWLFVCFQYYCFIRPNSELRFIKAGDVQLDDNRILIRSEISKNGKQQYVSIPQPFRAALQFVRDMAPSEYIFNRKGRPHSYNIMGRRHRRILKDLGFDHTYKLYSWKHTGAVACIKAGINVKELQIQLRHSSLDEVDKYLRQLGVSDLRALENNFPEI